eukprot:2953136-Heterocapsa_arctica.AAC.1
MDQTTGGLAPEIPGAMSQGVAATPMTLDHFPEGRELDPEEAAEWRDSEKREEERLIQEAQEEASKGSASAPGSP